MEAVAAFSLACNVIQVLDAANTAAETIYQIYKYGTSIDNAHLEENTRNLQSFKLNTTVQDPQLQQIAQSCTQISKELLNELSALKGTGKRDALKKSFRAMRKKGDIENLKAKIADHERTLNTGLLLRIKEQNDAAAVTHASNFNALDTTLQQFIINLANGNTRLETVLRTETQSTHRHVTKEHLETRALVDNVYHKAISDQQRQRFLGSLKFPSMNARRNQISENYPETFKWIFENDSRWTSFPDWLISGNTIYFVEGKAASGKSTLMKFIVGNSRTQAFLDTWKTSTKILSHYFWLSGDPLQRNLHGLLASLVYQILENDDTALLANIEAVKEYSQDWSIKELSALLHKVTASGPYCMFLDGLDEFDGNDAQVLMDLIHELASRPNIKLCLSSRPEKFYIQELSSYPKIRLQDLTEADIRAFVTARISEAQKRGQLTKSDVQDKIVLSIIGQAQGVFLWVHLALNSVLRGLKTHASMDELERRILQLPNDLGRLYENMLERLGDDWTLLRHEAAIYFNICLRCREYDIPINSVNLRRCVTVANLIRGKKESSFNKDFYIEELSRTRDRIPIVSAGLLEVGEVADPYDDDDDAATAAATASSCLSGREHISKLNTLARRGVRFTHRTALDFLLQQPMGQSIMQSCNVTTSEMLRYHIESEIIWSHCFELALSWKKVIHLIHSINHRYADGVPQQLEHSVFELLEYIRCSISNKLPWQQKQANQVEGTVWHQWDCNAPEIEYSIAMEAYESGAYLAVDFMGLTLERARPEYFRHTIQTYLKDDAHKALLSDEYLDYLLLLVSKSFWNDAPRPSMNAIFDLLIQAGANPSATLFLPPACPLGRCAVNNIAYSHPTLASNASERVGSATTLRARMGLCAVTAERSYLYQPNMHLLRKMAIALVEFDVELDEVTAGHRINSKTWSLDRVSTWKRWMNSRKRVVLVRARSGDSRGHHVSNEDSAILLSIIFEEGDLQLSLGVSSDSRRQFENKIKEISASSDTEGVDIDQYLKDKGYLKDPSDPAVPQGPIKRFRDGVDASNIPEW